MDDQALSDGRLNQIEFYLEMVYPAVNERIQQAIRDVITEARRLRRENHLLHLSRGTPSAVGRD